jgi:hypothetical protein
MIGFELSSIQWAHVVMEMMTIELGAPCDTIRIVFDCLALVRASLPFLYIFKNGDKQYGNR